MRTRPPAGPEASKQSRTIILLSVLSVVVVVVAIGAFVMSQGATTNPRRAGPAQQQGRTQTTTPLPTLPASAMTDFRDDETGFSIQYPTTWTKLTSPVREQRLVVTPNAQDYLSIRVAYTETPTTPQNLANIKAVTDGIIGMNPTVRVLEQKSVSINGMIGHYYLYTFKDEKSGLEGAHQHYFLFQGRKMNQLVFQALPADRMKGLEGVFNQMLASFHSDPDTPPSSVPPTTAPAATVP